MVRPKATREHCFDVMRLAAAVVLGGLASGCSSNSAKNHFILAERMWADGKYAAAVSEFEKVSQREPTGKLGLQSLFRAAMTQTLYLGQHEEAVRKLRVFVSTVKSGESTDEANRQIGEILFNRLERYPEAIKHYQVLTASEGIAKQAAAEYTFRIAKAQFFLWQFGKAIDGYREIIRKYPGTSWAERASFEIGATFYTSGEKGRKTMGVAGGELAEANFQSAIDAYDEFIHEFPKSRWVPEAKFGIAACLEELDQLDAALDGYQAVKSQFPSPLVVEVRIARILERKSQKRR